MSNVTEGQEIIEHNNKANHLVPYIVGIGASAGGLEPIEQFFQSIKTNIDAAFVIVQHLSSQYKSFMPELLKKHTDMKVIQAEEGMILKARTVYLCPPNHYIYIKDEGVLQLEKYDKDKAINYPINGFLTSLASYAEERAIGVIFSGKGSDGTKGLNDIHEKSGLCLIQNKTAKYSDMPESAIKSGIADFVISPTEMPQHIINYIDAKPVSFNESTLNQVLVMIQKKSGIDFSMYKRNTVIRRIERRMSLNEQSFSTLEDYKNYLLENPREIRYLQEDLLIGVTHFFRDSEAFNYLKQTLIPTMVDDNLVKGRKKMRIWVAGCSTGQEAYSLVILFNEEIEKRKIDMDLQLFATDIDRDSVKFASQGCYSEQIVTTIPQDLLLKYFDRDGSDYQVKREIRQKIVFAPHNMIKDSPFVNIDMISCRNVMIYFQAELQQKVLSLFHFALKEKGYLFLGPSETIGKLSSLFGPVNSKWKIFSNNLMEQNQHLPHALISTNNSQGENSRDKLTIEAYRDTKHYHYADELFNSLMDELLPPSIIINEHNEVVISSGNAGAYLNLPKGKLNYNIFNMVPTNLSVAIGTAIKRARQDGKEIKYENLLLNKSESKQVQLVVKPLSNVKKDYIALFIEEHRPESTIKFKSDSILFDHDTAYNQRIFDLEQELYYTKQGLQTTIEELETSNEELQSTNEELIAANEELQSTNEEMQSVNEELITVNTEYEKKIAELTNLNNDMDNLLINTNIATIFLDKMLNIKLYTPESTKIFHLIERDIGRPIHHISHRLDYEYLMNDIQDVLVTAKTIDKELPSKDGEWFHIKIMPYRTNHNLIEGIVITFVDISAIRKVNRELQLSKQAIELSPANTVVTDFQGKIEYANSRFAKQLGIKPHEVIGKKLKDIYTEYFKGSEFESYWKKVRAGEEWSGELSYFGKNGEQFWENLTLIPVENEENEVVQILRVGEDITKRKSSEQMLIKSEMLSAVGQLAAGIAHEIRNPLTSLKGFLQLMTQTKSYSEEYAEVMMSEFLRLEEIINEFLVLSRSKSVTYHEVNVNKIIKDVSKIWETQAILNNVSIKTKIEPVLFKVNGIENELKQVFINIVKNGIESMEGSTGILSIETRQIENDKVLIRFQDQGKGIPKEQLEKMGEPFYTTKEKGTGLGLMVSLKIIESHNGEIVFLSELNKGTTVEITLPLSSSIKAV
ncbi:PAS domain S-box protein [Metabacillus litoralis]|uniref:PAS domain S-box protein n=1 Tax=Metabacillus litoralis TaxID=152268 RepID=A0A5C6VWK6_9BACI|nr:CheR family methyltransferase [Metabacillus litoralis]TXC89827.1 PAS domain S-box protein [Metabacillus litoralis]